MAPAIGTANWSSYIAGVLGERTETTSDLPIPSDDRDDATRKQRRFVSRHVYMVLVPYTMEVQSP